MDLFPAETLVSPYRLALYHALLRRESVYYGSAHDRPRRRRLAAARARRREARLDSIAARSAYARAHNAPASRGAA